MSDIAVGKRKQLVVSSAPRTILPSKPGSAYAVTTLYLLLVLLIVYSPVLFGRSSYFMSDHCYYFQPFASFISERLKQGSLPLWNPYLYCGMAQVAVPSPTFLYPAHWLFNCASYSQALAAIMILHHLIAAAGAYLLVSSFGWGTVPCALAAVSYSLCGYMCSLLANFTLVEGSAWIPFVLWSFYQIRLQQLSRQPRAKLCSVVAALLTLACLIASGRPEVILPSFAALLSALAFLAVIDYRQGRGCKALGFQILALLAAIALTAPIWMPVFEWVSLSPRASGLNLGQVLMWSANWYDLVGIVFLQPFRDLQVLGATYLSLVATRPIFLPYVPSLYLGPFVLTLALWGFTDSQWRWRWLVLAGSIITLTLGIGEHLPVAPVLVQNIKLIAAFRYPIKIMIFPLLGLIIAAARGVLLCGEARVSGVAQLLTWTLWLISLGGGVGLCLMGGQQIPFKLAGPLPFRGIETSAQACFQMPPGAEIQLAGAIMLGALGGLLACALYCRWCRRLFGSNNVATLLAIAVAVNLAVAAFLCRQMTVDEQFFSKPQLTATLISALEQRPSTRASGTRFLPLYFDPLECPTSYRMYPGSAWTPTFYDYTRQLLLPNTNVACHVRESFGYEAAETGFFRKLFIERVLRRCLLAARIRKFHPSPEASLPNSDLPLYRFCRSTATSWIGTQLYKSGSYLPKLDRRYFQPIFEDHDHNLRVFAVKNGGKRAYFSAAWKWVNDQQAIADNLMNIESEYDPIQLPLIEHTTTGETHSRATPFSPELPTPPSVSSIQENASSRGPIEPQTVTPSALETSTTKMPEVSKGTTDVTILIDEPEHVSLSVNAPVPGFVVLLDHYYPGWQALVDGVARPIYRTGLEMRAVYIPSGQHLIEFNYNPDSFWTACRIALAAVLLIVVILVIVVQPTVWRMLKRLAGQDV